MVIILAHMAIIPEKRLEFQQTILSLIREIESEEGCLNASFYHCSNDENRFLIVVEWATPKDAEAHMASERFTVLRGTSSLMPSKPEIMIHTVAESTILHL